MKPSDYLLQVTEYQGRLYAYIFSLVPDAEAARDILQETNRALIDAAERYDADRPFGPWALGVAYRQVQAARRRYARDRLVFGEEYEIELLAAAHETRFADQESQIQALEQCLENLPETQRRLIDRYYQLGESLAHIGESLGRTAASLSVTLHRLRLRLADCIRGRLQEIS